MQRQRPAFKQFWSTGLGMQYWTTLTGKGYRS